MPPTSALMPRRSRNWARLARIPVSRVVDVAGALSSTTFVFLAIEWVAGRPAPGGGSSGQNAQLRPTARLEERSGRHGPFTMTAGESKRTIWQRCRPEGAEL